MSPDRTVRIWDYTQDACINVLSGHTAPVRGLMWNTEVPYLLISGNSSFYAHLLCYFFCFRVLLDDYFGVFQSNLLEYTVYS